MRISELVSNLTSAAPAQWALLIFLGVFVAIAWRHRRPNPEFNRAAALPLADDAVPTARPEVPHE